jgi:hypothetical protein
MAITVIKDIKLYEAQRDGGEPFKGKQHAIKLYPYQDVIDSAFSRTLISFLADTPNMFECIVGEYTKLDKMGWAFRSHAARSRFQAFITDKRPEILKSGEGEAA